MEFFINKIAEYVLGGFTGAMVALWFEKLKNPNLVLVVGAEGHADTVYGTSSPRVGERWKFFRVQVYNKSLPFVLRTLLVRKAAESCNALISVYDCNNVFLFSMKGRWASTPEIPHVGNDAIVKLMYPDPVSILADESPELLDLFTQSASERMAYSWNNESYAHSWRHPDRRLLPGDYYMKVTINTLNGVSFDSKFLVHIDEDFENTDVQHLKNPPFLDFLSLLKRTLFYILIISTGIFLGGAFALFTTSGLSIKVLTKPLELFGLSCDIIAGLLLWKYGLPEDIRRSGVQLLALQQVDEEEKEKAEFYDKVSRFAIILLIFGFLLQLISNLF